MLRAAPALLAALVTSALVAGCGSPPPALTPKQLCDKWEPAAEAWRVADGQDAATPERKAIAQQGCEKRWSEQQAADPVLYGKVSSCIAGVSKYEAMEQCVIDNLPVQ